MKIISKNKTSAIIPELMKELGLSNSLAVPKLLKIVLHIGVGKSLNDPKLLETALHTLERISGQKPVTTKAKKSISNFKLRKGQVIGAKVTLRRKRMFAFLTKFIHATLPRIRDFRGLSMKGFDRKGNYTVGIQEHIVFPEIRPDEIDRLHGIEIGFVTNAKNADHAKKFFIKLGFPFQKSEEQEEKEEKKKNK